MVTESLAHAHLAGTSLRPDRLQFTDDEDEFSQRLVLILLVSLFVATTKPKGSFEVDKSFALFLENVDVVADADFVVLLLRIALPLRCVAIERAGSRDFVSTLLFLEAIERFFSRPKRYFEAVGRFTDVLKVVGIFFVADD